MIRIKTYLLFFLLLLLVWPGEAFPVERKSALVVDMDGGHILYEEKADRLIQPASLSKIMTLYLVNEDLRAGRIHISDAVKISAKAVNTGGSKMLHKAGQEVVLEDLIKGVAVLSANDAAVAIAEHLDGSVNKFASRMNAKARELGMVQTHFVNPHGLPDRRQLSNANEIAMLSREYLRRFPDMLEIHSLQYLRCNSVTRHNRNLLLGRCPDVDGLKTGYVRAAGFHLIATAKRGDVRIIAVVMGAKTQRGCAEQARTLLEQGFRSKVNRNPASLIGG